MHPDGIYCYFRFSIFVGRKPSLNKRCTLMDVVKLLNPGIGVVLHRVFWCLASCFLSCSIGCAWLMRHGAFNVVKLMI